jgi:hypothetical protein
LHHCKQYRSQKERHIQGRSLKKIQLLQKHSHGDYEGLGEIIEDHCKFAFLAHHKYRKQRSYEHGKEYSRENKVNEIDREYQKKFQILFRLSEYQ